MALDWLKQRLAEAPGTSPKFQVHAILHRRLVFDPWLQQPNLPVQVTVTFS